MVAVLLVSQSFAQSTAEAKILALSAKKFNYMTGGKIDSLANLFDDKMLLEHNNGMVQTKPEYLENLKSGLLKYNSVDVKKASAKVVGSTAFVLANARSILLFKENLQLIILVIQKFIHLKKINGKWFYIQFIV